MPSRTIRPTEAPAAAPFAYTIGTGGGFTAGPVFVSWDGTGAGGDFLPCVSFYNSDGVLLARAFPDGVTLHPGDTAEVSYSPFRRGGGAASGTTLTVEDNFTVVPGVDILATQEPMQVTNPGGGGARMDYLPAYARGTINNDLPINVTADQVLPITTLAARNVTPAANSWTIDVDGTYLLGLLAQITKIGPLTAGRNLTVSVINSGVGGGGTLLYLPAPAIPSGQTWSLAAGFSRMIPCAAGDVLTVEASSTVAGTTFRVDGAWPSLLYLFP